MRSIANTDNSTVWLDSYDRKHPHETILQFFEKNDLGVCRYYMWQMLSYYGRNINLPEIKIDQASCITFFEDVVVMLEASYLYFHGPTPATHPAAEPMPVPMDGMRKSAATADAACLQKTLSKALQKQYTHYMTNATDLLHGAADYSTRQKYTMACYQLNQAVIQALSAFMICFLQYKRKTNNLYLLLRIVAVAMPETGDIFNLQEEEDARLFRLLTKAHPNGDMPQRKVLSAKDSEVLLCKCSKLVQLIKERYE